MASEITVQTIKGPTSGANANKVIIPSGQTLDASDGTLRPSAGAVVQTQSVQCGSSGNSLTITSGDVWIDIPEATITFTPKYSNSKMLIETYHHAYVGNNGASNEWMSCNLRITAGSSNLSQSDANTTDYYVGTYGGDTSREMVYAHESAYYSPASTSAIVFKVQANFRTGAGGAKSIIVNRYGRGMFKIMEIAQ